MKSRFSSRSLQLIGLSAKLGAQELRQRASNLWYKEPSNERTAQAKSLVKKLSQLKGAAMKVGQMLSIDGADYFGPEAREILSRLQANAEPLKWDEIKKVLIEDLGLDQLADFKGLTKEPIASASIGQVHRATLDGRDVAIKVQYPGVRDAIDSDLKILRSIAETFIRLSGKKMDTEELFFELSEILHNEADYLKEIDSLSFFYKKLQNSEEYLVPIAFPERSSHRVLTMSYINGTPLQHWVLSKPSYEDRLRIANSILNLYCLEFFDWGRVQTDPNYGNFLIQEQPLRLVLLDFGATREYSVKFRKQYSELLYTVKVKPESEIIKKTEEFELIHPKESLAIKQLFVEVLKHSIKPFDDQSQPFCFSNEDYNDTAKKLIRKFTSEIKYSPPPRQILFLHRKLGGIFALLRSMDVTMDLTYFWNKVIQSVKP